MTYNYFIKNASIVCHWLIIWPLISIPKKKKIDSKNDKLTWERDIIYYHIKFILTQSHDPHPNCLSQIFFFFYNLLTLLPNCTVQAPTRPIQETNNTKAKKAESQSQWVKNKEYNNNKHKKPKSNKHKLFCWQRDITYTYLIFLLCFSIFSLVLEKKRQN